MGIRGWTALVTVVMSTAGPKQARAGAWAQDRNHVYAKASFGLATADQRWDDRGNKDDAEFTKSALYLYGEFGVWDAATLILALPLVQRTVAEFGGGFEAARGTTQAFIAGDVTFMAKYQFLGSPALSLAVGTKIPAGYDTITQPALGTGKTDFDCRLLAGGSFWPVPAYITGEVGYRLRAGRFSDELFGTLEGGYTFADTILARGLIDALYGVGDDALAGDRRLFAVKQNLFRAGAGLLYRINDNYEADLTYLKSLVGENWPDSHEIFVGLAFKGAVVETPATDGSP